MRIPAATSNLAQARQDLATTGVAVLRDVLTAAEVARARSRLAEIAQHERQAGHAVLEDGSAADGSYRPGVNQRIDSLVVKDDCFAAIAAHPVLLRMARSVFAGTYPYPDTILHQYGFDRATLSSMTANIANPGGQAMTLHTDQGFVPPSTPFPILLNAVLPLVDFTADNGATRVAPGSHLTDPTEVYANPPTAQPVEAPAGSAVLIDGRTSHGTGQNRTDGSRPAILLNYCPPWVRPFTNHGLEVDQHLLEAASAELLEVLGYQRWLVFGSSETRQLHQIRRAVGRSTHTPR